MGKRVFLEPWANSRYQEQQQQLQLERQQAALREQLRREQLQQQHFPSQLWSIGWPLTTDSQSYTPSSSKATGSSRFFDFLQRPEAQAGHQQQQQRHQQQQRQTAEQQLLDDSSKSLGLSLGVQNVAKHQQPNGNEIANETNHENVNRKLSQSAMGKSAAGDVEDNVDENEKDQEQEDILDELYYHWATEQPDDIELEEQDNGNGRLPWRLFYRMHKNSHYAN